MIELTVEEYQQGDEEGEGRCLACGEVADCCEPDAREYTCDYCGEARVYGLGELLIMGEISIVD